MAMVNGHVFEAKVIEQGQCKHCSLPLLGAKAEEGEETCECTACHVSVHRKCIPYVPMCEVERERRWVLSKAMKTSRSPLQPPVILISRPYLCPLSLQFTLGPPLFLSTA